ncbi:hypothetical protein M23134_06873 [Microscilla marina ATCC 23134]|uniref:Uncharacterized protein n=1 Tax=Microscilla marina ATCC 23134 TaxID=313606 RepID=A1ZQ63_MICM2|nr:hypothetical protein M23134_06873 [Microscilla marina ATCC 23134]
MIQDYLFFRGNLCQVVKTVCWVLLSIKNSGVVIVSHVMR